MRLGRLVKAIVDRLKTFKVRVILAVSLTMATALFLATRSAPSPELEHFFQNVWIWISMVIATFLTFVIIVYVIFRSLRKNAIDLGEVLGGLIALSLLSVLTLLYPWLEFINLNADPLTFQVASIIVAGSILMTDIQLKESGCFPKLEDQWQSVWVFDMSILIGIIVVIGMCALFESSYGTRTAGGFSGGAITFQIILANLVFDPELYEPRFPDRESQVRGQ